MTNLPTKGGGKECYKYALLLWPHILLYKQQSTLLLWKLLSSLKTTGPSQLKETKLNTFHTVHRTTVFTASSHKCYVILTHACYVEADLPSCEKTHVHYGTCKIIILNAHKAEGKCSFSEMSSWLLNILWRKWTCLKGRGPKRCVTPGINSYKSNPDNHHNILKRTNYDSWAFKPLLPQEHSQQKGKKKATVTWLMAKARQ